MKKKILLLMGVFSLGLLCAQVGVNTTTPLAGTVLHIDGLGDTPIAADKDTLDDVFVMNSGLVGIGTKTPLASLDVTGKFRYVDGSEADGRVLSTTDKGYASWQSFGMPVRLVDFSGFANMYNHLSKAITAANNGLVFYTGSKFNIPPGKYLIFANFYITIYHLPATALALSSDDCLVSYTLSTSLTSNIPPKYAYDHGGKKVSAVTFLSNESLCSGGYFAVNNDTGHDITYYIWSEIKWPSTVGNYATNALRLEGFASTRFVENMLAFSPIY